MRDLAAAAPAFAPLPGDDTVGYAPAPGSQRTFSPAELSRLAARNGLASAGPAVCFVRETERLTRERVLAALREALPPDAGLELIDFSSGAVPKGPIEFPRNGLTPAPAGSPRAATLWRGRIRYAGSRAAPLWAKVRVWTTRAAALAVQDLAPGKQIQDADIRFENVDTAPFSADESAQIVGMSVKMPVRAGRLIPSSALAIAADVARGDTVELHAQYGAAAVRLEARAEGSGRTGDIIPVRNTNSGKTLRARVLRRGVVEVQ